MIEQGEGLLLATGVDVLRSVQPPRVNDAARRSCRRQADEGSTPQKHSKLPIAARANPSALSPWLPPILAVPLTSVNLDPYALPRADEYRAANRHFAAGGTA